jgi:4-amino-4-deoxy-L-arabinose transferase-like glycosyltransferase
MSSSFISKSTKVAVWRVNLPEFTTLFVIIVVAALLRFYQIDLRPGFEWDETIYTVISQNTAQLGFPAVRLEGGVPPTEIFLYHPPFDFILKSWWIHLGGGGELGQLRMFAASASIILLGLCFALLRVVSTKETAIVGLIFLALDGWLIYTNRLNLIENGLMPIGVAGILFYALALQRGKWLYYGLAGVFIGGAFVYKHIGIVFLLTPVIYLVLTRKEWRKHLVLFATAFAIIVAYVATMLVLWHEAFINQITVQVRRIFGAMESRGLNYGLSEALQAVVSNYWIFFVTVFALLGGGSLLLWRTWQWWRNRRPPPQILLYSWAFTAVVIMGMSAIKAPHYLIVLIVPVYLYLVSELVPMLQTKQAVWVTIIGLGLVVGLNLVTWNLRFLQNTDNALRQTYQYANTYIPAEARVLTEDTIGMGIRQPFYKLDNYASLGGLEKVKPEYLILYYSTTHRPPDDSALQRLVERGELLTRIIGFKEDIRIYRVNPIT